MSLIPFTYYVRLYTLHRVETMPDLIWRRVRIETLRYSFSPLAGAALDAAYAGDPREGVELARGAVLPRLYTLLDSDDPFGELGLAQGGDALWRRYAVERGLPADPARLPTIHVPARRLPARSRASERLAQTQRALELVQTAADTAATLAALWQNWQLGREKRKLLHTQRLMLQDAIQAQLAGQKRAFDHALDRQFVRGYLADHVEDGACEAVFGPDESPQHTKE